MSDVIMLPNELRLILFSPLWGKCGENPECKNG